MTALRPPLRLPLFLSSILVVLALATAALGCGGKEPGAKSPETEPGMDDALALLPSNAILVGTIDGRAFFGSQTFGSELAKLVEKYVPIGSEVGFMPSRDVDRVTFGSYSYQGVDVAAIVIGRFDSTRIKQLAATQTPTKSGMPLVTSQYLGRDVFTVNNVGFTLLSDTRAVVGTEQGIRRVLERIKDRRVQRDIAPWMIQTLETPSAVLAVAADFASQPIPPDLARQIPMAPIQGLKAVRVVATFKEGVQLAASLTYPEPAAADNASQSLKQAAKLAGVLAAIGLRVQNIDIKVDKSDVQVSANVDDQSLRQVLISAPQWIGQ